MFQTGCDFVTVSQVTDNKFYFLKCLCAFCWVIPWHMNFVCQHFQTLCLFHLHRRVGIPTRLCQRFRTICSIFIGGLVRRWNRQCSETSAYKIQTPVNYPEENIQHTEHGESLKSITPEICFNYGTRGQ